MFSELWKKIKELVRKVLPKKSIEEVLNVVPAMSDRMADSIQLWSDMYEGHSPWLKEPNSGSPERVASLGLPSFIASEKARMATLEMKSEITVPIKETKTEKAVDSNLEGESGQAVGNNDANKAFSASMSDNYAKPTEEIPIGPSERAEYLNRYYKKLLKQIRRQLEYGIAKGGLVIKPYVVNFDSFASNNDSNSNIDKNTTKSENAQNEQNKSKLRYNAKLDKAEIEFDYIQADRFFPLSFDANGKVVEAAFIQTKTDKANERVYIRIEYHKLEGRTVIVQNLAFESTDMSLANSNNIKGATNLGKPIPLTDVAEWASLQPKTVIEGIDRLLFAYFKMPEANTIDPYSPLGVSGYSRVISLIKDADHQYSRLLWEFEGGELAVDADQNIFKFMTDPADGSTKSVLPTKQERLFRKVDLNTEDTYNVFAPALRDTSLVNGLNTILMKIEDCCGLSRGTLSNIDTMEAKTATELKILKQRSYATNADTQSALQDALEDVVYVMDVYCELYNVTPSGDYEVSFEWDDSIIVDNESELSKRITLMQNGLASKVENRMWYFGETENQAKLALQKIDEEARHTAMQNAEANALTANLTNQNTEDNTKSPADTTAKKISKGKQADSLDNPDKSKTADQLKKS